MRILAISDIHGMYGKFIELLDKIQYNPTEDTLILLGDYIDRGSEPIKVLIKVMELQKAGAYALMGNHEKMLLDGYKELNAGVHPGSFYSHLCNGGETTWDQLGKLTENERVSIIQFINDLPYVIEKDKYIFVHAGVDVSLQLEEQDADTLLWIRKEFIGSPAYRGKVVVFGHTPTKYMGTPSKIWNNGDKIGIDCGGVFGGNLACLELPSMKEYYV